MPKNQDKPTKPPVISKAMLNAASPEFKQVVESHLRNEAANTIKRKFLRVMKNPQRTLKKQIAALGENAQIGKLREPLDDGFNRETAYFIKNSNYHLINYSQPDFTRHLFGALRLGLITSNEMMTAKLMYESLICFNKGKMPDNTQNQFQRYKLSDATGPYQPQRDISYWREAETTELKAALSSAENDEKLSYYTINLQHHQVVGFIFIKLETTKINHEQPTNEFMNILKLYIDTLPLSDQEKCAANKMLSDFKDNGSTQKLQDFILKHEPKLKNFLFQRYEDADNSQNLGLDRGKFHIEWDTVGFLEALERVECQIPSLCKSPQYNAEDPQTPILSFVLPTIDTLNTLQKIAHGVEATMPDPVIGMVTTRMIRADDELPANKEQDLTEPQQLLKLLYPRSAQLKSQSRPIELTHPDAAKTKNPHDAECHDFLLSWHDVFHAWRSGANFKGFIRHLRQLHDDKAGFANSHSAMSKAIWTLTDIDLSSGRMFREQTEEVRKNVNNISGSLWVLEKHGYDFNQQKDDNYLLLYSLCKDPQSWQDFLDNIIIGPKNNSQLRSTLDVELKQKLTALIKQYKSVKKYLESNPSASIVEIILHDLLHPTTSRDKVLLQELNAQDLTNVFYWSNNTGLYFKEEWRSKLQELGIKPKLRENTPELIRQALNKISLLQNPKFDITNKVKEIDANSNSILNKSNATVSSRLTEDNFRKVINLLLNNPDNDSLRYNSESFSDVLLGLTEEQSTLLQALVNCADLGITGLTTKQLIEVQKTISGLLNPQQPHMSDLVLDLLKAMTTSCEISSNDAVTKSWDTLNAISDDIVLQALLTCERLNPADRLKFLAELAPHASGILKKFINIAQTDILKGANAQDNFITLANLTFNSLDHIKLELLEIISKHGMLSGPDAQKYFEAALSIKYPNDAVEALKRLTESEKLEAPETHKDFAAAFLALAEAQSTNFQAIVNCEKHGITGLTTKQLIELYKTVNEIILDPEQNHMYSDLEKDIIQVMARSNKISVADAKMKFYYNIAIIFGYICEQALKTDNKLTLADKAFLAELEPHASGILKTFIKILQTDIFQGTNTRDNFFKLTNISADNLFYIKSELLEILNNSGLLTGPDAQQCFDAALTIKYPNDAVAALKILTESYRIDAPVTPNDFTATFLNLAEAQSTNFQRIVHYQTLEINGLTTKQLIELDKTVSGVLNPQQEHMYGDLEKDCIMHMRFMDGHSYTEDSVLRTFYDTLEKICGDIVSQASQTCAKLNPADRAAFLAELAPHASGILEKFSNIAQIDMFQGNNAQDNFLTLANMPLNNLEHNLTEIKLELLEILRKNSMLNGPDAQKYFDAVVDIQDKKYIVYTLITLKECGLLEGPDTENNFNAVVNNPHKWIEACFNNRIRAAIMGPNAQFYFSILANSKNPFYIADLLIKIKNSDILDAYNRDAIEKTVTTEGMKKAVKILINHYIKEKWPIDKALDFVNIAQTDILQGDKAQENFIVLADATLNYQDDENYIGSRKHMNLELIEILRKNGMLNGTDAQKYFDAVVKEASDSFDTLMMLKEHGLLEGNEARNNISAVVNSPYKKDMKKNLHILLRDKNLSLNDTQKAFNTLEKAINKNPEAQLAYSLTHNLEEYSKLFQDLPLEKLEILLNYPDQLGLQAILKDEKARSELLFPSQQQIKPSQYSSIWPTFSMFSKPNTTQENIDTRKKGPNNIKPN
jgi:hypothetical protein